MDLFRVAVVQAGSVPFDRKRSTMKDNARLAVRQYLGWRGINPVWVSSGYDRRERLELGPGVYANPFRLEGCHRNHLVQFALSRSISERICQTCVQRSRRRTRSRGAPANSVGDRLSAAAGVKPIF
jgi:hypothetical protein